ncbi:MAG: MGMT family protein [Ginsengibacter sp.]
MALILKKSVDNLLNIPFGTTISYLELSKRIENVKAIRAVGTCNGRNRLCIIVPCHRVIGSNGSLIGYGGDLWRKNGYLSTRQNMHMEFRNYLNNLPQMPVAKVVWHLQL